LGSLNRSLDPLDLELSRIRNEVTGKDVYALVSAPQLSPINSLLGKRVTTIQGQPQGR
jgi:hypothetical protein